MKKIKSKVIDLIHNNTIFGHTEFEDGFIVPWIKLDPEFKTGNIKYEWNNLTKKWLGHCYDIPPSWPI